MRVEGKEGGTGEVGSWWVGGWEGGEGTGGGGSVGGREGKESGAGGGIMASLLHVAAWLHCSLLQVYPCMFSMFSQSSATAVSIEWDL